MILTFGEQEFFLCASGILLWPEQRMGIVSDMHLEKGSHFAKRGFFLPPYDSQETLQRLLTVCEKEKLQRLTILGDGFHDAAGYDRLPPRAKQLFDQLRDYELTWIRGNHDSEFVPEGIAVVDSVTIERITFCHQAVAGAEGYEISGHFHPKIVLIHKGGYVQKDCFVSDGQKFILPAFGSYTGGMPVDQEPFSSLFKDKVNAYALGEERVFRIPVKS